MKNTIKIYILIFTLGLLLVNCTLASDATPPQLPAQYYGKVISPNPLSGYIEVKIGDKNYSSIPLVNNTFGGPSYLDGKLLVNAPGQDGKEVKFYLNGSISLNNSDNIYYSKGDVRFIKLYYNIDIEKLEILKEIVVLDEGNITDIIDINNVSTNNISGLEVLEIPLKSIRDTVIIPKVVNVTLKKENITKIIENINKTLEVAKGLKSQKIESLSDVNDTIEKIVYNITPILASNFSIANKSKEEPKEVNNKVISTISFKAVNTSKKGFVIVRIPIGNMTVENITIYNGTYTAILNENNNISKIGWYRIPIDGVLEITVIEDPEINVTLSAKLPDKGKSATSRTPSGGDRSSPSRNLYPDVAPDIKSEKIKEIVHKAKVMVGSEIDKDLSAKDLKTTLDLTNKPLEINEDCILVGGPVANPIVNKYLWAFPVKVTNDYPGKHKGVIQIQKINGHTVILLAGSDRWGTKAAVEYFKTLEDLPDGPIFVEWKDEKAFKINKP